MDMNRWLEPALLDSLVASAIVIVLAIVARAVVSRTVARHVEQPESRRRWLVSIRNWVVVGVLLALATIWGPALRTFAVSIVAVAVAFVVATKEIIACFSGSVLRTTAHAYSVGDRIEMGIYRGDVIDVNFFSTTILEVGPGPAFHLRTGRTIVIPNSKLLDTPIVNESSLKGLVLHTFSVPMNIEEDWEGAEQILFEAAQGECTGFVEPARIRMEKLERDHGLEGIPLTPRVSVHMPDAGKINLIVRLPAPVGRQGRIEQAVLRRFLRDYRKERQQEAPSQKGPKGAET